MEQHLGIITLAAVVEVLALLVVMGQALLVD